MFQRSLGALLLLGALTLSGCGGGGGGGDVSPQARAPGGGSPTAAVSAAQKANSAATTDTVADVLQQVAAAEDSLTSGDDAMGGGMRMRIDAPTALFTSRGAVVFEKQAPTLEAPQGFQRTTEYRALLVAGVNFTDSDADGRVSSQAEKDSITAWRLSEKTVRFSMDFATVTMTASGTVRAYGDANAVVGFGTRSFTNTMAFDGAMTPGRRPTAIDTAGRAVSWSGAAAAAASDAEAQGGAPDPTTSDRASRNRSSWDFTAGTHVSDFAGTAKLPDGRWKLSLGHNAGSVTRSQDGPTVTHQGTARAWTRSSAYDLDAEVTSAFAFTPTGADTQVSSVTMDFTSSPTADGQRVLQGTVRDDVRGLTFTFTVQDGQLTGTIVADTPNGPVQVATVTLDRHGNGRIVFADGTVVILRNFHPVQA